MSRKFKTIAIRILFVFLACSCATTFYLREYISDEISYFQTRLNLDNIEERHYTFVNDLRELSQAQLIREYYHPIRLFRATFYPNCVVAGYYQIYATDRAYADVISDYQQILNTLELTQREVTGSLDPDYDYRFRNVHESISILIRPVSQLADTSISQNDRYELTYAISDDEVNDNYQTLYSVGIAFGEPATMFCSG